MAKALYTSPHNNAEEVDANANRISFVQALPKQKYHQKRLAKINISIRKEGKYNNACRLASLALKATENNRERHKFVENFMLVNDSSTVACEVPVWFWEKNLNAGISGHVDILQIRNGLIHILDFKPDAEHRNCSSALPAYRFAPEFP